MADPEVESDLVTQECAGQLSSGGLDVLKFTARTIDPKQVKSRAKRRNAVHGLLLG